MFALVWTSKTQQEIKTVPKYKDISSPNSKPRCKKCQWGIYSSSFARPLQGPQSYYCQPLPVGSVLHPSRCGFLNIPLLLLCLTVQSPPLIRVFSSRILKDMALKFFFLFPLWFFFFFFFWEAKSSSVACFFWSAPLQWSIHLQTPLSVFWGVTSRFLTREHLCWFRMLFRFIMRVDIAAASHLQHKQYRELQTLVNNIFTSQKLHLW